MATVDKKKRNTKYANLSDEERKQKYKELSRECYKRKTPEEKKEVIQKVMEKQHGLCDVCNNGKVYSYLAVHQKTKAHLKMVEQNKKTDI